MGTDNSHSAMVAAGRAERDKKDKGVPSDLANQLKEHASEINRALVLMSIIGNIKQSREGSFVEARNDPGTIRQPIMHEAVWNEVLTAEDLIKSIYPETSFKRINQNGDAVQCEVEEFNTLCKQFGVSERPIGFPTISSQHSRNPENEPHTGAKR
jgi:hypothetical protein